MQSLHSGTLTGAPTTEAPRARPRHYVALDLETTGLLAETDRVVEVAAVRFDRDGCELGRFASLVNPGRPMSPSAQAVHGLGDEDLADAPPASEVLPGFLEFLGDPDGTTLLAHNAAFDAAFLGRELGRLGLDPPRHDVVDTLALSRRRLPGVPNHRLDTLAHHLGLHAGAEHRALDDSLRVKGLWLALNGPEAPTDEPLFAYRIGDVRRPAPAPVGWDVLAEAMDRGWTVRLQYAGGTHGPGAREVTPRAFANRGGVAYLVAHCHLDSFEKSFRLDRVRRYEVVR